MYYLVCFALPTVRALNSETVMKVMKFLSYCHMNYTTGVMRVQLPLEQ